MKSTAFTSAIIYTAISLTMAGAFLIATLPGEYRTLERFGGAIWVFSLSMIILMPIIIPLVKKRRGG